MAKFIRLEDKLLNIESIACVLENKEIVKHGDEWFDPDEKEVKGVVIFMNGDDKNGFIFESITLDDIEDLLK